MAGGQSDDHSVAGPGEVLETGEAMVIGQNDHTGRDLGPQPLDARVLPDHIVQIDREIGDPLAFDRSQRAGQGSLEVAGLTRPKERSLTKKKTPAVQFSRGLPVGDLA